MIKVSWGELKRLANDKALVMQWVRTFPDEYLVYVVDGFTSFECSLIATQPEYVEFETDWKTDKSPRVTTSIYSLSDPEERIFAADATAWTVCPPGETAIDLTPSTDSIRMVDGGTLSVFNANPGDWCRFQVISPQGALAVQYINKWFVPMVTGHQDILIYPAKIYPSFKLRVVYTNIGQGNAQCGISYRLHI